MINFTRELLTHSLEGRRIDLLTLTSFKDLIYEREPSIPKLFPVKSLRPYKAKKPIIFISARVHPGEVPGSHVMRGLLDFLTPAKAVTSLARQPRTSAYQNQTVPDGWLDPRAIALLNQFVIKIVPMLNPDGVARGHFRFDTLG
jgi:hypothetical protein